MAFNPSVVSRWVVSAVWLSESVASVSVRAFRVVSDGSVAGEFSCQYKVIQGNTVNNSKKKTATDLKFDNEYYFCNNSKLAQN